MQLALNKFGGKLDGLVLNHGVLGQVSSIDKADPEQWKWGFDVNFISLVTFVRQTTNPFLALFAPRTRAFVFGV